MGPVTEMRLAVLLLGCFVCSGDMELTQPLTPSVVPINNGSSALAGLEVQVKYIQKDNRAQELRLRALEKQLKEEQVAFSASLLATGSGSQGPYKAAITLIFKHVFTNIGKAYNSNTGVFTAPVKGAYHFEIHAFGLGGSHATGAILVLNSRQIFTAYEYSHGHGTAGSSNGVSLALQKGDVVFVRLLQHNHIFDNSYCHSTFSGHLLFTM
ncbi:cerebellin-4 isoform X2 [Gadus morhua]|uniref:cerebellin-4 isoform X2 n=1 Tax=Gadus morhua TaxID=8049 RepID=UPI0011B7EBE5|nr:cerebellin-4-like isoform X2 [Gadus morhua]